ncbi:hypothetical protein [Comamonas thiooxydans]|uniref:hypothetical protein n=1 Tax=Comamonas thiooxydans TaxID=363952 RepID=UPI0005F85C37|nr:hypothetical protein [Comamonas thiooxydans]
MGLDIQAESAKVADDALPMLGATNTVIATLPHGAHSVCNEIIAEVERLLAEAEPHGRFEVKRIGSQPTTLGIKRI